MAPVETSSWHDYIEYCGQDRRSIFVLQEHVGA